VSQAGRPGRRTFVRAGRRLAILGAVAALIVALAQSTTTAAFNGQTSDTGNQASTAATFCTSPGTTTPALTPTADTAVDQSSPNTNFGTGASIGLRSASGANAYSYLRFDLTAAPIPARCTITSATLTIRASAPAAGATLEVHRANAAWTTAMTWNTGRVGFTGTPSTTASLSSAGVQTWDVTTLTRELYAGTNNGFALKDSVDNAGPARTQTWDSMEAGTAANRPKLTITWG
jgi:hypothetical protein